MAHQNPNTANIPNEFDTAGKKKLYGKELRALWCAPKNRLLVGVDAEGIQLRIFAHYINEPEFTEALVNGKKEDKSDPHSLNQSILGPVCKSRAAAKRYIYALLLGAGQGKLREILDCDERAASEAYDRLLSRYTGFAHLKETVIPRDAKRGWFVGLDGRRVRILGETEGTRRHLSMSGYLQNGEAVVMKMATLRWLPAVTELGGLLVNFVHDEWQTEVPNNMKVALQVAELQADSLRVVGEELGLLCPLAGSYWNDDHKIYTIHKNWSMTH
jgi:DNA polymerase-1